MSDLPRRPDLPLYFPPPLVRGSPIRSTSYNLPPVNTTPTLQYSPSTLRRPTATTTAIHPSGDPRRVAAAGELVSNSDMQMAQIPPQPSRSNSLPNLQQKRSCDNSDGPEGWGSACTPVKKRKHGLQPLSIIESIKSPPAKSATTPQISKPPTKRTKGLVAHPDDDVEEMVKGLAARTAQNVRKAYAVLESKHLAHHGSARCDSCARPNLTDQLRKAPLFECIQELDTFGKPTGRCMGCRVLGVACSFSRDDGGRQASGGQSGNDGGVEKNTSDGGGGKTDGRKNGLGMGMDCRSGLGSRKDPITLGSSTTLGSPIALGRREKDGPPASLDSTKKGLTAGQPTAKRSAPLPTPSTAGIAPKKAKATGTPRASNTSSPSLADELETIATICQELFRTIHHLKPTSLPRESCDIVYREATYWTAASATYNMLQQDGGGKRYARSLPWEESLKTLRRIDKEAKESYRAMSKKGSGEGGEDGNKGVLEKVSFRLSGLVYGLQQGYKAASG